MNSDLVHELTVTLESPGWGTHIKPALRRLRSASEQVLLAPGQVKSLAEGKQIFTDDYIKGRIATLDWMLAWETRLVAFAKELEEANRPPQEVEGVGNFYAPTDNPSE